MSLSSLQVGSHKIKMSRGYETSAPAYERHLTLMQERYGEQVLVNLLGSKEGERMLSLNFQVNAFASLQPLNILFDNNAKTVQISACPRMIS